MMKSVRKDVEYYMRLPYTIEVIPYADGGFFARVKELEGCMTEADTLEDVYEMIEDAKRSCLEAAIEDGSEIPLPESMEEERYSGRILIRIPKSLHRKLVESARDEGMSVNTYIVSLLSERNATRGVLRKVLKELQSVKGNHLQFYV